MAPGVLTQLNAGEPSYLVPPQLQGTRIAEQQWFTNNVLSARNQRQDQNNCMQHCLRQGKTYSDCVQVCDQDNSIESFENDY